MSERDSSTSPATTAVAVDCLRHLVVAPIRYVLFWTAVVTPFLYVPLLVTGLDAPGKAAAFAALVGVHVVTLVLGHSYRPA